MSPGKLCEWLAATGRPCTEGYARLFKAAVDVGMNDQQAFAFTCLGYDAAQYPSMDIRVAESLQVAGRKRHAEEHPNGMWATLFDVYQHEAAYMRERDGRAMEWASHATQLARAAAKFGNYAIDMGQHPCATHTGTNCVCEDPRS